MMNNALSLSQSEGRNECPLSTSLEKGVFFLILICSAVFRIYYAYAQPTLLRDSYFYSKTIQQWGSATVFFQSVSWGKPLLYQLCASLLVRMGMSPVVAGQILNIIAGVFVVILTFVLLRSLSISSWLSLGGMLLVATHPTLIEMSGEVMREMFMMMFSLACIYFFLLAWHNTSWLYFFYLSGCCLCMLFAVLSRYEGIATSLLIGIYFFYQIFLTRKKITRRRAFLTTFFIFSNIVCVMVLLRIYCNSKGLE